ncbi:MAG: hypothetical protein WB217_17690 [Mesobacillus sp.]
MKKLTVGLFHISYAERECLERKSTDKFNTAKQEKAAVVQNGGKAVCHF